MCDCYSNGSSPHVEIINNESSEKILVFPGGEIRLSSEFG